MIKNSCQRSQQVMSHGFTVMTWKQRSGLHSGRAKHPSDPKKLAKFDPKSRCCLVFFDACGVIHHEYLPEGSTVNQTYYIEVLKRLRDAIRRKRSELWRSGDWFFHHDDASAHSALRTREFLAKHSITVLPHPPYSPGLAPCDFFLFPMLQRPLKGRRFETIPEITANATKKLKGIKKEA